MKKFLFLSLALSGLCACTTPEEDTQIKLFWLEQIMQLMPKQPHMAPLPPHPLPPLQEEPPDPSLAQEQPPRPEETVSLSKSSLTPQTQSPEKKPESAANVRSQFLEITLEDSSRVNHLKSNASLKERQAMQRALENVKQSNQQALHDIGIMFDGDTQAQAFAIVSKSEKILQRTANTSMNYQNYLNAQHKILQEQEAQLNQLMRQNAYKLRRIRG